MIVKMYYGPQRLPLTINEIIPLIEIVNPSGLIVSFDSPAYRKIDLSERSTQMISIPTQEEYIDQMVNAMRFFFGTGDDTYADPVSYTHLPLPTKRIV